MREQLEKWVQSRGCYFYLAVGTLAAFGLARWSRTEVFLPIFMTLVIYPVYAMDLTQRRRDLAIFHTFFWALTASVLMFVFVRKDELLMSKIVFRGVAYRDEMFRWILTGEGREGNWRLFLPEHLKHFFLFCTTSLLTAGVWGLAFGAVLLNYMNFYVASLVLKAHRPLLVYLLGWPPWSLLRVIGFVVCGVALSEPFLSQLFRFRLEFRRSFRLFGFGLFFILADILLKAYLANFWRNLLRHTVSL